jgi:hypothetical protein
MKNLNQDKSRGDLEKSLSDQLSATRSTDASAGEVDSCSRVKLSELFD